MPPTPQDPPTGSRAAAISLQTLSGVTGSSCAWCRSHRCPLSVSLCPGSHASSPAVRMSAVMAEGCFMSALQPNSSCTAYVLPSDGPSPDPVAKARRVREQVRMRLAEKKSLSLPRLDDSLVGSTGEHHGAVVVFY